MSEESFEILHTKKIYAILDGDTDFGEYETSQGKKVRIALPYLSGSTLCGLSTQFGLARAYPRQGGALSRWEYVKDLLDYCIGKGTCSKLLDYFFSETNFQNDLQKLYPDDRDKYYELCVKKAFNGINSELSFSNHKLVRNGKQFSIAPIKDKTVIDTDMLDAIIGENPEDPFSSVKQYQRCEQIGKGGFGEIYRYHNPNLDMDFAVKIYKPYFLNDKERKEGEKRFFRESKMLFSLNHKNIVRIYDAGRIDGNPFIRMEYLPNGNLEEYRIKHGNLNSSQLIKIAKQILKGLQHAHQSGIIHRDLKPSNIGITVVNGRRVCKIIDFGISAFMETDGYTKLTKTGEQIAGGQYIDPLLMNDPSLRDPRSDVYSVGAIMYFLLTGRGPGGSGLRDYIKEANNGVDDRLIDVIMKSMSADIDKRFNSCEEFEKALTELEDR